MTDRELLQVLITVQTDYPLGKEMFRLFSECGFPPDMFLEELDKKLQLTPSQKLAIINTYLVEMMAHKLKSGIGDKRKEKLQEHNKELLKRFLKTGEVGIY